MSSLIVKVVKVFSVEKHPNADRLSIVTVESKDGWNCIVGLDQYKAGDLVVFVPPDCVIPEKLIEKYNLEYLKHNGRTGTVKLRGYISQGLILELPEGNWKEGDNVAEVMGITKYEVPEPSFAISTSGKQTSRKKLNPYFDKYTDIENVKNFSAVFVEGDEVVITEKIHGTNSRYGLLKIEANSSDSFITKLRKWFATNIKKETHEFCYGSHNVQLTTGKDENFYGENVYGRVGKAYNIAKHLHKDMIVYGEIYGSGIQDLTYGAKAGEIKFAVFDIKLGGKYLDWNMVETWCGFAGIPTVPVLYKGAWYDGILKDFTDGKSTIAPDQIREGVVVKPLVEQNNPRIGRKILKSVSETYLLRKGGSEYK